MSIKLTHEGAPGVEVYFLEVTPELAAEFLENNTKGQRTISPHTVDRYTSDMLTMDWIINGETIKFSDEGELLDGQHRLSSIVKSEESQVLLIVTGLDKASMATIDAGRTRTFGDVLKMKDTSNHLTVAALGTRAWHWFHDNYGTRNVARTATAKYTNANPSNAQKEGIMKLIEAKYEITFEAAAAFGQKAYAKRKGISASTYGLAWIILSGIDRDLRENFFHEVVIEAKSPKLGYPIQALHNRLMNMKKGDRMNNVDQLDAIFTVYNAWLRGSDMVAIRPPRPVRYSTLEIPDGYTELEA